MKKQQVQAVSAPVMEQRSIGELTRDAYIDFGHYINTRRHLVGLDGVKISYRRLIYSAMLLPKGKLSPTTPLISSVANIHPHGLSSFNDMVATLVKSGIFEGEGSFGYTGIDGVINPPANDRYTHTALSKNYWDLMGDLIKEVPYSESPIGPLEPDYLPLPLPLNLTMSEASSGLGVGVRADYPNFSPQSLYLAYKNNNPQLLEPRVDLILDKSKSELDRLWNTGKGKVTYVYKISRQKSPDGKTEGILFETVNGTEIFTPKLKAFEKLEAEGKVYIEDLTDVSGAKLFVGRIPGARGITVDDIEGIARKCCYSSQTYNLNVTDTKSAFRIPLKDWIDFTYKRYIELVSAVNQKRVRKCQFDISVQESIPAVVNYITTVNPAATDEELSVKLGLSPEIISEVLGKPIGYLRKNKDTSARVKALKDRLKELKKFDPVLFTEEVIQKL